MNLSKPSHRELSPLLFANSVWFLLQQNLLYLQGLLGGACDFSFLTEKTNKSNRLQMSLQRQNFLPSYLRPWVLVRAGVWNRDLPLSRLSLFCWTNQAAVDWGRGFLQLSRWKSPINRIKILTVLKQQWFRREEIFSSSSIQSFNIAKKHKFCGHRFEPPWLWLFQGSYFLNNFLKPYTTFYTHSHIAKTQFFKLN